MNLDHELTMMGMSAVEIVCYKELLRRCNAASPGSIRDPLGFAQTLMSMRTTDRLMQDLHRLNLATGTSTHPAVRRRR